MKLGPYTSKIHTDELIELLDLWQYPKGVKEQLTKTIRANAKGIEGPHLFRYYNPRPSKVAEAECMMAGFIGTKYALAVNSCTSALITALRALGVGAGDEVIVPGYTFFASAAVIGTCNAIPVIVDVDDTLTIDPRALAKAITKRTKAIIVVHMRGMPAQMDQIMRIAKKHKIPVIEDVAQAAGGKYKGKMLGSIGTMGCFSFDYYKVLNSGEGGFVTTNDQWLLTRAQSWHDCAACWRPDRYATERKGGELFCGENYRMSELQGAVALAQIRKAPKILAGYRAAKARIIAGLDLPKGVTLQRVADPKGDTGICLILFMPDVASTKAALPALQKAGVPAGGIYDHKVKDWHVYVHWEHILTHKAVAPDGLPWTGVKKSELPKYTKDMCPQCNEYLSRAIMIDTHCEYSAADCRAIATAVNQVLGGM
ncbi:MAG: 8-amino-3,8-dideoxy-alpha-D-manno-octulosonate transaminase [Verrucomicrobiae bacterium]|nr:8-amino-3,8-dideoxy-alpha-D-manno-octulosonate transaminase [Verrucomicrobiae bacterium]